MSKQIYVDVPGNLTNPYNSNSLPSVERIAEVVSCANLHGVGFAADLFKIKPATVDQYISRYRTSLVDAIDFSDLKEKFAAYSRRWDTQPVLEGDWMILFDAHVPIVHWPTLEKACAAAQYLGIKNLLLPGDWFDFESISKFDFGGDQVSAPKELELGRELVERLLTQFDRALMFRGNHEERLIKFLKKVKRLYTENQDLTRYGEIMKDDLSTGWHRYIELMQCDKLEVSNDSHVIVKGPHGDIVVCHASTMGNVAPNAEEQLCYAFGLKHVINGHIHNFGIRTCKDGKTLAVRSPIVCDQKRMFYKQKRTTAHYGWVNGFSWIKDGKIGLYVDNPAYFNPIEPVLEEEANVS